MPKTAVEPGLTVTERIGSEVSLRPDAVFVPADFRAFGSAASVRRALRALEDAGVLVRLGRGLFAKAKPSALTGKPIPVLPLEVLAALALRKLGIETGPSRAVRAYNSGKTTQVPAGVVLATGKRRIRRRIGFGGKFVEYERG